MHAQFDYRLSRTEYVIGMSALVDEIGRQDRGRTRRLLEQLAIVVVVMLAVTFAFPASAAPMWIALLIIAAVQSLLLGRWTRDAGGQTYDLAVAGKQVEFTDEGVSTRSVGRDLRCAWRAVRRVHDLDGAIVLELVGWDMIVLPDRLWDAADRRKAFLGEVRALATEAIPAAMPAKPALFGRRDLLRIGAIAAGVDALALVVFAVPVDRDPAEPIADGAFLATYAAMFLLGLALAYVAYRLARPALERLHDRSPDWAAAICYALIWVVPAFALAESFD